MYGNVRKSISVQCSLYEKRKYMVSKWQRTGHSFSFQENLGFKQHSGLNPK